MYTRSLRGDQRGDILVPARAVACIGENPAVQECTSHPASPTVFVTET